MGRPILRLFDGFEHTSPYLQEDVRALQAGLRDAGYPVEPDGLFGRDTEAAVKEFQKTHGIEDDGIVGQLTWSALLKVDQKDVCVLFPCSYEPNDESLLEQLKEAVKYRGVINEAASAHNIPPSVVAGIGSRESKWGLHLRPKGPEGTGDFAKRRSTTKHRTGPLPPDGQGFGRGLMQIDFDAHEFARTGNWRDPAENIRYGCGVLAQTIEAVRTNTSLRGDDLLAAAVAGYNCGTGNVLRAIRDGRGADYYTAGRDYSGDVLSRAGWFQLAHGLIQPFS